MQRSPGNHIKIKEAVHICLEKNLHFAAFRLPGEADISMIIQRDQVPYKVTVPERQIPVKGFLIAPFSMINNDAYLIKPDIVFQNTPSDKEYAELINLPENFMVGQPSDCPEDIQKVEYLQNIHDSLDQIKANVFDKVVLSRIKTVKGDFHQDLPAIFMNLCETYTNAFVYLFSINGQCWTGATPEPFLCSQQYDIRTASLAGTRSYNEKDLDLTNWNKKELQEQEYVTCHIERILDQFKLEGFIKTGPYVAQAGNLLHLRTDFTFPLQLLQSRLPSFVTALHPTPAVCGMDTENALEFIQKIEKHDREYYTGFLGPVGFTDMLNLYVNLRCLKVYKDCVALYVGAGITSDSVPEEEWQETEIKAETLLSVIKKIR